MFNLDKSSLEKAGKEPPKLTIRKPSELLAYQADPTRHVFANRMLTKGESLSIIGPSGSRKSWLVIQMAACVITGKPFLGWPTKKQDGKWLILQTENDEERQAEEMKWLHAWLGEDDWKLVEERLVLHSLVADHDRYLNINEGENHIRLSHLVQDVKASFVVFDPLYSFRAGNLNSDEGMFSTCRALSTLARLGNPEASPIIVHHTLTGREGLRKAVGFDRASYSRGSKAIYIATRRQLHIAPENPQGSDKLVIACGKNSNTPEFPAFGIMLDPATMIYEPNPAFDLRAWFDSLSGEAAAQGDKPTAERIAELVAEYPQPLNILAEMVKLDFDCKDSKARALIHNADGRTIKTNEAGHYTPI